MVVNKRSKNSRARGSWTHGWGAKKKHRGAGHRGGRGKAGSGKRGDTKKPSLAWKDKKYFGKYGFKSKNTRLIKPINISILDLNIDKFVEQKLASKERDKYVIDLGKVGYNKLLGAGNTSKKLNITVKFSSAKAVEKIKAAGGDVTVSGKEEEDVQPAEEAE